MSSLDSNNGAGFSPAKETWLNLNALAKVTVTTEDPDHRIEAALEPNGAGWRAGGRGEQSIRLIFDPPQSIRRIRVCFSETKAERTQEFSLRWRPADGFSRQLVRQQWNFSTTGATTETEDYYVELDRVAVLELTIQPDISHGEAVASLDEFLIA